MVYENMQTMFFSELGTHNWRNIIAHIQMAHKLVKCMYS